MLSLTHKERFDAYFIRPSKCLLVYGPPGVGKTLLGRTRAVETTETLLKLV